MVVARSPSGVTFSFEEIIPSEKDRVGKKLMDVVRRLSEAREEIQREGHSVITVKSAKLFKIRKHWKGFQRLEERWQEWELIASVNNAGTPPSRSGGCSSARHSLDTENWYERHPYHVLRSHLFHVDTFLEHFFFLNYHRIIRAQFITVTGNGGKPFFNTKQGSN